MSGKQTVAYAKCRCGKSLRLPDRKPVVCSQCKATVEPPAVRRRAPDVVLPRL